MKTLISFRLRKGLDEDLIAMNIDEGDLPELCRNGLRLMLGINTQKTTQVIEQPITQPHTSKSKPVVFVPTVKGGGWRGKV